MPERDRLSLTFWGTQFRWLSPATGLLTGFLSVAAPCVAQPGAPQDGVISCARSISCTIEGGDITLCPHDIGGNRLFYDQPRFVLNFEGATATLDGGATYQLRITDNAYRFRRRKAFPGAIVEWEAIVNKATGALTGQTRIRFNHKPEIVEFRYGGYCSALVD